MDEVLEVVEARRDDVPRPQQRKRSNRLWARQFPSCLLCVAAPAVIGWSAAVGFGLGIDALTPCCQGLRLNFSCRPLRSHHNTTPPGRFVCLASMVHVSLPKRLPIPYRRPSTCCAVESAASAGICRGIGEDDRRRTTCLQYLPRYVPRSSRSYSRSDDGQDRVRPGHLTVAHIPARSDMCASVYIHSKQPAVLGGADLCTQHMYLYS